MEMWYKTVTTPPRGTVKTLPQREKEGEKRVRSGKTHSKWPPQYFHSKWPTTEHIQPIWSQRHNMKLQTTPVTWKEKIRAHIKPENIDKAYQFIRDQGAGDLIKNEVSFSFGRGQDIEAKQVKEMYNFECHPMKNIGYPNSNPNFSKKLVSWAENTATRELLIMAPPLRGCHY